MAARGHQHGIDPEWVGQVLEAITNELAGRFPDLPGELVSTVVTQAITDFVCAANVTTELPALARRRATARLLATHPQPATAYVTS